CARHADDAHAARPRPRPSRVGDRPRPRSAGSRSAQTDARRRLPRTDGTVGMTPAARGPLFLVLHQARYDVLGTLRNRQARFFTLALPVIFLFIFVGIFGNHVVGGVKLSTTYVPGLSALGVISSSFINLVISITVQREEGILKRRRASPVPAWVLIAGRTF